MRNEEVIKKFFNEVVNVKSSNGNLYTRGNGDKVELVNYSTVIAYIQGNSCYLSSTKYSRTTGKIQNCIKRVYKDYEWKYELKLFVDKEWEES